MVNSQTKNKKKSFWILCLVRILFNFLLLFSLLIRTIKSLFKWILMIFFLTQIKREFSFFQFIIASCLRVNFAHYSCRYCDIINYSLFISLNKNKQETNKIKIAKKLISLNYLENIVKSCNIQIETFLCK